MKFPEIELPSMFEVSKIITLFKISMNKHNGNLPKEQVYPFWLMYFVSEGFFYYKKNGQNCPFFRNTI